MTIHDLQGLLEGLDGSLKICVVDRNDSEQQTIEIVDIGFVQELGQYVIWAES